MVGFGAVRADTHYDRMREYSDKLNAMSLPELVKEFISFLDYTEESESGREFHPVTIGSCRVLMSEPLGKVLLKLRQLTIGE